MRRTILDTARLRQILGRDLAVDSRSNTMVEVSGTVSDACAQCHEVYRDKEDPKDRCVP